MQLQFFWGKENFSEDQYFGLGLLLLLFLLLAGDDVMRMVIMTAAGGAAAAHAGPSSNLARSKE